MFNLYVEYTDLEHTQGSDIIYTCIYFTALSHNGLSVGTVQKSHYPQRNHHASHCAWAKIKVLGHQYHWLAGCYNLEIGHLRSG